MRMPRAVPTMVPSPPKRLVPPMTTAAMPFNALLFGVENCIFLLAPTRAAATPGDFQGYGRQILVFFVKGPIILAVGSVAGVAAFIVHRVSGSMIGAVGAAAAVLVMAALAMVPAVAWAFA